MNNCPPFKILRILSIGLIFLISLFTVKTFALDNQSVVNLLNPTVAAGFDIGALISRLIGWLFGFLVVLLWIVSRLLSFLFQFLGGIMYGFFINNPLDTELDQIRQLWSFLVDFGNLLVVFSFIALAITYLFNIKIPGMSNKGGLGNFFGGIVIIALLLNFSLTFTSAFATTVHNIGIGSIFFTLDSSKTAKLDLSTQRNFNRSIRDAGSSFFISVTNNFVENVSCLGTGIVKLKTGDKSMAEICEFHVKDQKGSIDPLKLISASDGSPQATNFYLTALIREIATIILLGVGCWVIYILLKVAIFRLAYLWLVGIFAGPALVAAFSPFDSFKKYFDTWLKWLVTFSTMMIIFVYGFYLSSYVAQIPVENKDSNYEALPSILESPGIFVSTLVNNMVSLVVPNIMFPIIGLAILYLLGKYLDETYQTHAASALKAGGELVSKTRKNVSDAIAAPGKIGSAALRNTSNLAGKAFSLPERGLGELRTGLGNATLAASAAARMIGAKNIANRLEGSGISGLGRAAVDKQKAQQKIQAFKDFGEMKGLKKSKAEQEYLGKMNNLEVLKAYGASESSIAEEAKKAGVSQKVIQQGQEMANSNKYESAPGGRSFNDVLRDTKMQFAQESNKKNFQSQFDDTKRNLKQENENQKQQAESQYLSKSQELVTSYEREKTRLTGIMNDPSLSDSEKNKKVTELRNLESNHTKDLGKLTASYTKTRDQLQTTDDEFNKVATNVVNTKFLEDNPDVERRATRKAYEENKDIQGSSTTISSNKIKSKEKADRIDSAAELVFSKLKAIDESDKNETDPTKKLSPAKKEAMRKAILESTIDNQQGGAYTAKIKRLAETKYKNFRSNPYDNDES